MPEAPAEKKRTALKKRALSGAVLAPLIIFIVLYGGWLFALMIAAAAVISLYEWYKMSQAGGQFITDMLTGTIYLLICISSFAYLRFVPEQGAWLALSAMLCVWASDTGAYFTGKALGGPKMAPSISPNKTLSGLGGAMVFCGLALVLLCALDDLFAAYINTNLGISDRHYIFVFFTGCVLGFFGQTGDLFISSMKRRVGVKDTGNLIPGHGGLLDRIDALLLISPAFLVFVSLWL